MASDIWLRTTQITRKEICCPYLGYSFRLAAKVLLYAQSHRQDWQELMHIETAHYGHTFMLNKQYGKI